MFKMLTKFSSKNKQSASIRLRLEVNTKIDHKDISCDCVDWVCDKWILELEDMNWIQPA
jgi:hypothetical protein